MSIEELEKFVELIRKDVPLSRVLYVLRNTGGTKKEKKSMSKFTEVAPKAFPDFMDKGYVAQSKIPFTVIQVSNPIVKSWPDGPNRMREVKTVYLTCEFSPTDFMNDPNIDEVMSISFSVGEGYERDNLIDALREDALEGKPDRVILTKWKNFYSLAPAK